MSPTSYRVLVVHPDDADNIKVLEYSTEHDLPVVEGHPDLMTRGTALRVDMPISYGRNT